MDTTYFGPAQRASVEEVEEQRHELESHPVIRQLLEGMPEAAAVLNLQRQIVMANSELIKLSPNPPEQLIGLRPGEALNCVHVGDGPGGCGTAKACRLCGAVTAILTQAETRKKQARDALFLTKAEGGEASLDLRVTAAPLSGHDQYILLSMRDVSDEKRRMVLERLFYHDLLNSAGGLNGLLQLLAETDGTEAESLRRLAAEVSEDLVEAIKSGRDLAAAERGELTPQFVSIDVRNLLHTLAGGLSRHEVAHGKDILVNCPEGAMVHSDATLLGRVLGNLVKNGLEAIREGQAVTMTFTATPTPTFQVHNPGSIPDAVQSQIFKRSFSTKAASGRGIGTYSVKLLTERYLSGAVTFQSTIQDGTTFVVTVPASPL
ncbi:MAG: HAMP domain-containing histidine kinase [Bryobacterales bacterium]|nr:HAMP domain-containing histidine kinase [Bryobacterales bacterium]